MASVVTAPRWLGSVLPVRRLGAWPRFGLCGLAIACMGAGLARNFGTYSTSALLLLLSSAILVALALREGAWERSRPAWVVVVLLSGLGNLLYPLGGLIPSHPAAQVAAAAALAALAAAACVLGPGRGATALLTLGVLSLLGLIAVVLVGTPGSGWSWGIAGIDVFRVVSGATRSLLEGHNPYTPLFHFRQPNAWEHFVYGPAVPVLAAPGLLLGDVRSMSVVAVLATILGLWRLARQGTWAADAHRVVALSLTCPIWVGIVYKSWVDVYLMAGVVWWLALRDRHRRWSAVALGVALLVKPTALLLVVPAFLWSRRGRVEIAVAGLGALMVTTFFAAITGIGTYLFSTVGFQLWTPFRADSLNLAAWLYRVGHLGLPVALPLIPLALGVLAVAWRGRPRCQGDLALQAALLSVSFYLLAKQAFFDYYFDSEVMLLAAIAAAGTPILPGDVRLPWPGSRSWAERELLGRPGRVAAALAPPRA